MRERDESDGVREKVKGEGEMEKDKWMGKYIQFIIGERVR